MQRCGPITIFTYLVTIYTYLIIIYTYLVTIYTYLVTIFTYLVTIYKLHLSQLAKQALAHNAAQCQASHCVRGSRCV